MVSRVLLQFYLFFIRSWFLSVFFPKSMFPVGFYFFNGTNARNPSGTTKLIIGLTIVDYKMHDRF